MPELKRRFWALFEQHHTDFSILSAGSSPYAGWSGPETGWTWVRMSRRRSMPRSNWSDRVSKWLTPGVKC